MGRRQRHTDPTEKALLDELRAVYADVEAAYAGYRCPGSTECCRFAITGREPYVTSIELRLVERAVAARGGPVREKKRALPIAHDSRAAERVCPLLDAGGQCAIYADRPFGCRSFWCDRADTDRRLTQSEVNAFVRRIQAIAERHEPGGHQGRPLTRCIG
jgi:Fe-S-cluster containining protein